MHGDSDYIGHKDLCRQIVRTLIQKYEWTLLSEDDLVAAILHSSVGTPASQLEKQAKNAYMTVLYETCRQNADLSQREKGYIELSIILNRLAYRRNWPELAEDAVQRALQLIL